jgi:hypothetical protein
MESVTWLRWRSATPPVLMHQDCPSVPAANFHIILCGLPYSVVGVPLADRGNAVIRHTLATPLDPTLE